MRGSAPRVFYMELLDIAHKTKVNDAYFFLT